MYTLWCANWEVGADYRRNTTSTTDGRIVFAVIGRVVG